MSYTDKIIYNIAQQKIAGLSSHQYMLKTAAGLSYTEKIAVGDTSAYMDKLAARAEIRKYWQLSPKAKQLVVDSLKPGEVRQLPGKMFSHGGEGDVFKAISKSNGPVNSDNSFFNTIIKRMVGFKDELKNPTSKTLDMQDVYDNPALKDLFASNKVIHPGIITSKYYPKKHKPWVTGLGWDDNQKLNLPAYNKFKELLDKVSLNDWRATWGGDRAKVVVPGLSGKNYALRDFSIHPLPQDNVGYDEILDAFKIYDPRISRIW